jgi:hypothetical protein
LSLSTTCEAMLLKGWYLLSSVLPGCTCLLAPSLNAAPRGINAASGTGDGVSDAIDLINQCARDRSAKPDDVVAALAVLRAERPRPPTRESFGGTWELVWNDKLAKVPVVNGYMPNRETLVWDLDAGVLDLRVETLPFLPEVKIRGENLTYDEGILGYTVGDKAPSTWDVFHADGDVVCAVSSATGVNVIRRIG